MKCMRCVAWLSFVVLLSGSCLFAGVPNEFTYQGRIRQSGQQKTGTYTMNFKIYNAATAGTSQWESGPQTVAVTNGMFAYRLAPEHVDWRTQDLWLETVLNDTVLSPREKLTSHFFAIHAGTAENISSTSTVNITIGAQNIATFSPTAPAQNLVNNTTYYMVPRGAIIMWSGAINMIPAGWVLCDGTNGTPNLTDRFVVGAGNSYSVGNSGGANTVTLSVAQLPSHAHSIGSHSHSIDPHSHTADHSHSVPSCPDTAGGGKASEGAGSAEQGLSTSVANVTTSSVGLTTNASGAGSTGSIGSDQSHENRPPYYALAFIMKN